MLFNSGCCALQYPLSCVLSTRKLTQSICFRSYVLILEAHDRFVLVIVCPCIGAFFLLRKFYVKTSREVKRIEGTSRSPLYAHLSMTVDGLAIVRTYPGAAERILDRFSELHDNHTRSWFTFILTSRWLGFRLDLIVSSLVFVASFSAVAQRDTIGAGNAGLSLAYIMTLTGTENAFICSSPSFVLDVSDFKMSFQVCFSGRCGSQRRWKTN